MAITISHLLTATHNSVKSYLPAPSYDFRVYSENANWSQHQNVLGTLPGLVHLLHLLSSALVGA